LGGVWIGVILISMVTSLPEVFTGISAITIVNAPDITIGNIFGANTYNLVNLALLDFFSKHGSIMSEAKPGHRLTAYFSLSLLIVASLGILLGRYLDVPALGWVGWFTPAIIILYMVAVRQIFLYERNYYNEDEELVSSKYGDVTMRKVYIQFGVSAVFIIGAGIWLAMIGRPDCLSHRLGTELRGQPVYRFYYHPAGGDCVIHRHEAWSA